ncbi:MAG: sugar transferase [Candidatus Methylomirabilales bacterium]
MDILYVSQYFPPEMGAPSARVYELSKHWVKAGHRVTVLTGFPNHPTGIVPQEYRRRMWRLTCRERIDGIEVVRTWLYPAPNRRPWERMLVYGSFGVSASLRGLFLERPDVVIGSSPQLLNGLAGWWISRLKGCPFVFEVRDLWPESLLASGIGKENSFLMRRLERLALFLYQQSDRIVVVTDALKDCLVTQKGLSREIIHVVENGVETGQFFPRVETKELRQRLGLDGKFVVSYIGTMGYAHGLEVVLEAADRLREVLPDVVFLLVGEGAEKARLQEMAAKLRLDNLQFVDQQPRDRIPAFINMSDVCLVPLRRAELFATVLPSKMLEFMACGRPVVLGVDGQARTILDEAQAGIYVPPGDPEALIEALLRLYRDSALRARLGENGRAFIVQHFAREEKALEYLHILERLIARKTAKASGKAGLPSEIAAQTMKPDQSGGVPRSEPAWKRTFDITLASLGFFLFLPVWLLISVAIYLEDGRPILFVQKRVGKGRKEFTAYKFRTIYRRFDDEVAKAVVVHSDDQKVMRVGRILRKTALNELPQLLNILRGDMSFVGPRPEPPEFIAAYEKEVPNLGRMRYQIRPGLTGIAQVYGPHNMAPRNKLRYDLLYMRRRSLWLDIKLIGMSVWNTLRAKWDA